MLFYLILFSLQGPEPEWELEAFPLTGLESGAFLVTVSELDPELFPELPFPVSLRSMWEKQEKALFCRAMGGEGCRGAETGLQSAQGGAGVGGAERGCSTFA